MFNTTPATDKHTKAAAHLIRRNVVMQRRAIEELEDIDVADALAAVTTLLIDRYLSGVPDYSHPQGAALP